MINAFKQQPEQPPTFPLLSQQPAAMYNLEVYAPVLLFPYAPNEQWLSLSAG